MSSAVSNMTLAVLQYLLQKLTYEYCETWRRLTWYIRIRILYEPTASTFRANQSQIKRLPKTEHLRRSSRRHTVRFAVPVYWRHTRCGTARIRNRAVPVLTLTAFPFSLRVPTPWSALVLWPSALNGCIVLCEWELSSGWVSGVWTQSGPIAMAEDLCDLEYG